MNDDSDLQTRRRTERMGDRSQEMPNPNPSNIVYLEQQAANRKPAKTVISADIARTVATNSQLGNSLPGNAQFGTASQHHIVSFHRRELELILNIYGFKVADGEWRDYAIDMLKDRAIFSVYRNSREVPLHCIEKNPKLARKQGMYSVTGTDGRVLKRGHDLASVLKVFEKKARFRVV